MTDHAWCSDPARDAAVRAAEDNRTKPLPTLGEAIAAPFADAAERSSTVSKTGDGQSGIHTERVTLECVHRFGKPPREWDWWRLMELRPGESVRVVEEAHFDDLATLAMERDAAIRERDAAKARVAELHILNYPQRHGTRVAELEAERDAAILERDALQALVAALEIKLEAAISERDKLQAELEAQINRDNASILDLSRQRTALTVRVSDLESQLESVACRAADAEMELEAASGGNRPETPEGSTQAASGGGVIRDMVDIISSDTDADEKHAAMATLVEAVCPGWVMTKAASGGGEPVASTLTASEDQVLEALSAETKQPGGCLHFVTNTDKAIVARLRKKLTSAPPQPRGWLTAEQRDALRYASQGLREAGGATNVQAMKHIDSILARSTPPEVVLPPFKGELAGGFWAVAGYNSAIQVCREALAAAGVAVKEVGK